MMKIPLKMRDRMKKRKKNYLMVEIYLKFMLFMVMLLKFLKNFLNYFFEVINLKSFSHKFVCYMLCNVKHARRRRMILQTCQVVAFSLPIQNT
jgi:hypothetical protein